MESGLVVYGEDGVTEVFNKHTRTLKIVKRIPFSRNLRYTTTVHQDPLFATETPTWFFTAGAVRSRLIEVTHEGDKMIVTVNTFFLFKRDGSHYEDPNANWGGRYEGSYIMLGVY